MNWDDEEPVNIGLNENPTNPEKFILYQNYPNPFNPVTKIKYEIPLNSVVNENFRSLQIKIYDALGKEISTLVNQNCFPETMKLFLMQVVCPAEFIFINYFLRIFLSQKYGFT